MTTHEIKTLFPHSGWKIIMRRYGKRIEIALHWNDKTEATHVAAIEIKDMLDLINDEQ